MTKKAQEAYIRGFRKVAEANGVDPQELMKVAKRLGGPDPAPGMLGAKAPAKSPGFLDNLKGIADAMPTGHFSIGPLGLRPITRGQLDKMTSGLSPFKRMLATFNPMLLNFKDFRTT